jgi:hypothetical protein
MLSSWWLQRCFFPDLRICGSVIPNYGSGSGRPIYYGSGSYLDIFVAIKKINMLEVVVNH